MRRSIAMTAILFALPTALFAQAASPPTPVFLKKAGASDLFERQEGQLMSSSANVAVRRFAQQMVRDHTKSTTDIKAATRMAKIRVGPPTLSAEQTRNLRALRAARGMARDRVYIDQQKTAHRAALALMEAYSRDGEARPLRMAAAKIAPVVRMHLGMLSRM
jgi:putative membrane protein